MKIYQVIGTKHDRNGNPRRVTLAYDGWTGAIVGYHIDDYSGCGVVGDGRSRMLPQVQVDHKEFKTLLTMAKNVGREF